MKTALIAGASGLVGHFLLERLLDDADYQRVVAVGRRRLERSDPKLEQIVTAMDPSQPMEAAESVANSADVMFCCIGTTLKKAGSKQNFRRIDHDLVIRLGEWARALQVPHFVFVSAMGAKATSLLFYNRVKGETERDLEQLGFSRLSLLRPSLLLGDRPEERAGEDIGKWFSRFLNPLLPRKYRAIHADDVAAAMQQIAAHPVKAGIFDSAELLELAARSSNGKRR